MTFKNVTTQKVVQYIHDTYDAEPEFLWAKTPNNSVFRHKNNSKWFAAILQDMEKEKLDLKETGNVDILDLKCEPNMIGSLLDGKHYLPGYHMNKQHWITIVLDDFVSLQQIFQLIDLSYELTKTKPKRKAENKC